MKYYAGIGSRETPKHLIPVIDDIVNELNVLGYTLRSGGAKGADTFFEKNALKKEIFLPWKEYNNNKSQLYDLDNVDAFKIAKQFYTNWENATEGVKKIMARNTNQILGKDLNHPVEFVICWTKDGKASGGTGFAIKLAKHFNIPIFNLYHVNATKELKQFINPFSLF